MFGYVWICLNLVVIIWDHFGSMWKTFGRLGVVLGGYWDEAGEENYWLHFFRLFEKVKKQMKASICLNL